MRGYHYLGKRVDCPGPPAGLASAAVSALFDLLAKQIISDSLHPGPIKDICIPQQKMQLVLHFAGMNDWALFLRLKATC